MGLTIYKPPKKKKNWKDAVKKAWIASGLFTLIYWTLVIGNSIGVWLHTGVWHW